MYCKHCGERITDDSQYCKYCGGKQDSINQDIHKDNYPDIRNEESPIKIEVYKKKEPRIPKSIDKKVVADYLTACFKELMMILMAACIGFVFALSTWAIFVGDYKRGEYDDWCTGIVLLSIVVRYVIILFKWVKKNKSK